MSTPSFEQLLDACIDDIAAGRRSVADCLERWPQHAARLRPLLEAAEAMHGAPRVPQAPPDPLRRAQFMAEIRQTPQLAPRCSPLVAIRGLLATFGRAGLIVAPVAAVAAIALLLVLPGGSSTAYASTLTVYAGSVELQAGGLWQPIADGATVNEGDRLRTGTSGEALLTFPDGSTTGIEPGSELIVERARLGGAREIVLHQFAGRLWNSVAPGDDTGATYTVETPDATVTAHGTVFETIVSGETTVHTSEGEVELRAGDERIVLAGGESRQARAHRLLAARQAAGTAAGERPELQVTVDAPFVASLLTPTGKATGARPDGVLFHQIAGVLTSNPGEGPQVLRLRIQAPESGVFLLVLRRVGEGEGEIVFRFGGRERRVPLDAATAAVELRLRVGEAGSFSRFFFGDGGAPPRLAPADPRLIERLERIVVTEREALRARAIAEQLARRHDAIIDASPAPEHDATPLPPSDATREPLRTPTPTPTSEPHDAPTVEPGPEPTATSDTRDSSTAEPEPTATSDTRDGTTAEPEPTPDSTLDGTLTDGTATPDGTSTVR